MAKAFKDKRKNTLFINSQFQGRFLLNILLINALVCIAFYAVQSYFFSRSFAATQTLGLEVDDHFVQFLQDQREYMNFLFLAASVVITAGITIFGLIYSHRIAGPFHHLKKHLKGRISGQVKHDLKFREKDHFQDIASALNEYIHWAEGTPKKTKKSA